MVFKVTNLDVGIMGDEKKKGRGVRTESWAALETRGWRKQLSVW